MTGVKDTSANKSTATSLKNTVSGTSSTPKSNVDKWGGTVAKTGAEKPASKPPTPSSSTASKSAFTDSSGAEMTRQKMTDLGLDPTTGKVKASVVAKVDKKEGTTVEEDNADSIVNDADTIMADAADKDSELQDLGDAEIDAEGDLKESLEEIASAKNEQQQKYLDELKAASDRALDQKNLAITQGAETQKRDAEIAFEYAQTQEELQRKRTEKSFNDQLYEQKATALKAKLSEESRVAALGGFGNSIRHKEMVATQIENDRLINDLVFDKNEADAQVTADIVKISDTYKNDLQEIEIAKQSAILNNYNDYLAAVEAIQNDREISENAKAEALAAAATNYKTNVAQITSDSFDKRYEVSTALAATAREVSATQEARAKTLLSETITSFISDDVELTPAELKSVNELAYKAGYPIGISLKRIQEIKDQAKAEKLQINTETNDNGDLTVYSIDTTTGKIVSQETLKGIGKLSTTTSNSWKVISDGYGGFLQYNDTTGEWTKIRGGAGGPGTGDYDPNAVSPDAEGIVSAAKDYINNGDWKQDFKTVDVLEGGTLGCAWVVSGALEAAGILDKNIANISSTVAALESKGWTKTSADSKPKQGDIVVWAATAQTDGHKHIGIVTGDNKAMNNQGVSGPAITSISGRPVEGYWTPPSDLGASQGNMANISSSGDIEVSGSSEGVPTSGSEGYSNYAPKDYGSIYSSCMASKQGSMSGSQAESICTKEVQTAIDADKESLKEAKALPQGLPDETHNPDGWSKEQALKAVAANPALATTAAYAARMERAERGLTKFEEEGVDIGKFNNAVANVLPDASQMGNLWQTFVLGKLKTAQEREYFARRLDFISALLRRESGAAITASEYTQEAYKYFPGELGTTAASQNAARIEARNRKRDRAYATTLTWQQAGPAAGNWSTYINSIPEVEFVPYAPSEAEGVGGGINSVVNTVTNAVNTGVNNFKQNTNGSKTETYPSNIDSSDVSDIENA
jgi:hypothetical protein